MNAMLRTMACAVAGLTCTVAAQAAQTADKPAGYPTRPLRIIISVAPGAGADFIARATAQMLIDKWGQNAVVDSRPGGGGVVAVELTLSFETRHLTKLFEDAGLGGRCCDRDGDSGEARQTKASGLVGDRHVRPLG